MQIREIITTKDLRSEKVFTVSEFLEFLNNILRPCQAIVKGEVGERIDSYPRYTFFNLLDAQNSVLKCFAFKEVILNLGVELTPGMEIKVIGYPEIRKNRGELKFQVERIELVGEGILKKQYEILKKKLEGLGYFAPEKKKAIPRFCENIGLITSQYGKGAKKDFLTHLGNFGFKIFFYDVRVEGSFSLYEIIEAIRWFNANLPQIDVLVLTRGGGDWESLHPFNSEEIVKAIFASKIPIVTGIGHENDETLADLAADFRASTPTHAAKFLTENWKLASVNVLAIEKRIDALFRKIFKNTSERINVLEKTLPLNLQRQFSSNKERINNLFKELNFTFQHYFRDFRVLAKQIKNCSLIVDKLFKKEKQEIEEISSALSRNKNKWLGRIKKLLKQQEEKLSLSNPHLKLKQGYTITYSKSGKILKRPSSLKNGQLIRTRFYKGQVWSIVKRIKK